MSSSSSAPSKVSFTVRRPTPVSRAGSSGLDSEGEGAFKVPALPRHLSENGRSTPSSPLANGTGKSNSAPKRGFEPVHADSSDDEEEDVDEIVVGFDQFGVQRWVLSSCSLRMGIQLTIALPVDARSFAAHSLKEKKKDEGPLVIPALPNKDWREIARKRKAAEMFVPAAGAAKTGADGSVGGLGTRDSINSGPVLSGLVKVEKKMKMEVDDEDNALALTAASVTEVKEETDDEKAMRAIIAAAKGTGDVDAITIEAIPSGGNNWSRPVDEGDAYRRDVVNRPDVATLEDYDRVPVEQFGAALLRGMGWKPGQAASRTRTGPVEPYLPASRPALLGIGAKERDIPDDGSNKKKPTKPERRYIPVIRKEREGSGQDSGRSSRRSSRSPDPDRRRDRERDSERDRTRDKGRERDRDNGYDKGRDRKGDYNSDRDRDRYRDDKVRKEDKRAVGYDNSRDRERDRDRDRRRDVDDRDRDRKRDRDSRR